MDRVNARLEARKTGTVDTPPLDANVTPPPADTDTDTLATDGRPAADPRENDPAYWRQRFNVTQGMLRTQQENHRAAVEDKDRVITELRDKVRSLESGKSSSASDAVEVATFFTPEQIERFGQDQCEAMATAAVKAARQQAQALLESEVKPLRDKAKATQAQAQEDKEAGFWEKLAEQVPDYPEINKDPAWLEWLTDDDADTGMQRQDILDRHRGALNAIGVAKLFQKFKATKTPARTPPVAPPRSAAGGQNDGQASNVPAQGYPTQAESKEFYKRAKLGKVTDQERVLWEQRLKSKAAA